MSGGSPGPGTLLDVCVTTRRTELVYARPDGAPLAAADYDRLARLHLAARRSEVAAAERTGTGR
ncbi:hypothetical protein AB0A98_06495 [Streptomyces chrestomyceticus]|uniref:hypothetical protein n=1 Tax=Streptomyces chrestomyceticus TaxID=68185 RepID=UPI0033C9E65A